MFQIVFMGLALIPNYFSILFLCIKFVMFHFQIFYLNISSFYPFVFCLFNPLLLVSVFFCNPVRFSSYVPSSDLGTLRLSIHSFSARVSLVLLVVISFFIVCHCFFRFPVVGVIYWFHRWPFQKTRYGSSALWVDLNWLFWLENDLL